MALTSGQIALIVIGVFVVIASLSVIIGMATMETKKRREIILVGGYVDGKGAISRSLDAGTTWVDAKWPFNAAAEYVKAITHDGARFFACTSKAFCTSVNGKTWSPEVSLPSSMGEGTTVTSNGKKVVVAGMVNGIAYSKDNGQTWTNYASEKLYASHATFNGEECAVATLSGGIYVTVDAGATWERVMSAHTVYDVARSRHGKLVAALGTVGVGSLDDNNDVAILQPGGVAVALAFNNKGTVLVGGYQGAGVNVYNEPLLTKVFDTSLTALAWTGARFVGVNSALTSTDQVYMSDGDGDGDNWHAAHSKPWPKATDVVIWAVSGALVNNV